MADNPVSRIPKNIVERALHYYPRVAIAIVCGVVFTIASVALFTRVIRNKHWWGLCLPIGSLCYAIGFFLRPPVRHNPTSLGLFIAMQLFLVCSPAAFLAFNYIVYGRLIQNNVGAQYSLIRPNLVANVFVASDIITFLVQGGGGGMQTRASSAQLGADILLAGLILQTLSYVFFTALLVYTHWKIHKKGEHSKTEVWWKAIWLLYISSAWILIRGAYRVVELAQGPGGYLVTHEAYLYGLDTFPLFFAIAPYMPYWPGSYIYVRSKSTEHILLEQRNAPAQP